MSARLRAAETRVDATVASRGDRVGGRSRRVRRARRAVERVRPLGVLDTVDRHDLVRVTRSRLGDDRLAGGTERDLGGADTSLGRRVDHDVHALAGRVRAARDDVSRDRIRGDTRGAVQGAGHVDGVIAHTAAVVEPDRLGRHRRNGAVEGGRVDEVELQLGRTVVAVSVLHDHRNAPVTVDAGTVTTRVRVVLGTDGSRAGETVDAQPLGDVVVDGVVLRLARRSRHRDGGGSRDRSRRGDVVERVAGAAGREVGHGPVTQHARAEAQTQLDDLRVGVGRHEVCPRSERGVAHSARHVEAGLVDPPVVIAVRPGLAHEVAVPGPVAIDIDPDLHARLDAGATVRERDAGLTELGERRRRDRTVQGCLVLARPRVGGVRRLEVHTSGDERHLAGGAGVGLVPAVGVQVGRLRSGCDRRAHLGGGRRRSAVHGTVPVVDETGGNGGRRVVRHGAVRSVVLRGADVEVLLLEAALDLDGQLRRGVVLRQVHGRVVDERLGATGLPGSALRLVRVQRHVTRVESLLERDRGLAQVGVLRPGQRPGVGARHDRGRAGGHVRLGLTLVVGEDVGTSLRVGEVARQRAVPVLDRVDRDRDRVLTGLESLVDVRRAHVLAHEDLLGGRRVRRG